MTSSSSVPSPVYIYALVDPRNASIRYIGKTINPAARLMNHRAPSTRHENSSKGRWIAELYTAGHMPDLHIIDTATRHDWKEKERFWIRKLVAEGHDIFNISAGGEGGNGWKLSSLTKAKMSKAQKGRIVSEETRRKISVPKPHRRGGTISYAARVAMSRTRTGDETRLPGIDKKGDKWRVRAMIRNKYIQIGRFDSLESAQLALQNAINAGASYDGSSGHDIVCKRCSSTFKASTYKMKYCAECQPLRALERGREQDKRRRERKRLLNPRSTAIKSTS